MSHELHRAPAADSPTLDDFLRALDGAVVAAGTPVVVDGRHYVTSRPFSARHYGPILEFMSKSEDESVRPVVYGTEAAISHGWLQLAA